MKILFPVVNLLLIRLCSKIKKKSPYKWRVTSRRHIQMPELYSQNKMSEYRKAMLVGISPC
jgi:hypothetical protein